MGIRIAVDTGGTFTDFVLSDTEKDRLIFHKTPSTPSDPSIALVQGILEILEKAGTSSDGIQVFIHGTTVATNTILQRNGALTALITTAGFRDVLHIQRQDRPQLYNMRVRRTPSLIPRHLRFELGERLLYDGEIQIPVDTAKLEALCETITDQNIEAVAVGLLHSHINPEHELEVGRYLKSACPDIEVCLSHTLNREEGEYERFSTCAMNAYVQPVMARYLNRIDEALSGADLSDIPLYVMRSNGGIMSAEEAAAQCVHTILSGPAGGVVAGLDISRQVGSPNLITADMGGTSFDVAMIHEHAVSFSRDAEIDGLALRAPMLDIHTVGAGGGSIAWIDAGGALRVGPQSAGADPGPVCYGRGGKAPTVTDANLILGRLASDTILEGSMSLDLEAATETIRQKIADPLDIPIESAAEGIIRVVNASMTAAIRKLTVERGFDPRKFALVPFGGAGPLHAGELAREMDIDQIIIPLAPGVTSAVGLLSSNLRSDRLMTCVQVLSEMKGSDIDAHLTDLRDEAEADLSGISFTESICRRYAGLRYLGQGFDIRIDLPNGPVDPSELEVKFNNEHKRQYGFSREDQKVQLVTLWVSIEAEMGGGTMHTVPMTGQPLQTDRQRPVYLSGKWYDTPIYGRDSLAPGHVLKGPAVIEQLDSTTLIWPDQVARINKHLQMEVSTIRTTD